MVDRTGAAAEKVKSPGGKVINGPMEVSNGEWVVQCLDPKGGAFSLVSQAQ